MRPGKLKKECTSERDLLETVMASLATMQVTVEEITMRNSQALKRTDLVSDVLEPSTLRLAEMRKDLHEAHTAIAAYYALQGGRWRAEEEAEAG